MGPELWVLIAFIFFGLLAIVAFIQAQSYIQTTSTSPDYQSNQCSPDQALYAWIWNFPPNGVCPPFSNQLIVEKGVLYQKAFVSVATSGCCYFTEEYKSVVLIPGVLIGIIGQGTTPTDGDLNKKPYTTVGNYIQYIVPFCDANSQCIEYSLVSRAGSKGTYKIISYSGTGNDSKQQLQKAQLIVSSSNGVDFLLEQVIVDGVVVYTPTSGTSQLSDALIEVVNTFEKNQIYPIPSTRPS